MYLQLLRSLLIAAVLAGSSPSRANEDNPQEELSDYAVLTPAVEGRYFVVSGFDPSLLVNPLSFSIADIGDNGRTKALRALIERETYDPAAKFAAALERALGRAGFTAVQETVERRPAGRIQSLSWSDLPESPRGNVMIDTTILWICLCSDIAYSKFYPAIGIRWRLLESGQRLIEPARNAFYFHYPESHFRKKKPRPGEKPPDPATIPPQGAVSESCGYRSTKAADEDPRAMLQCLDEAIESAADRVVWEIGRAATRRRPPSS